MDCKRRRTLIYVQCISKGTTHFDLRKVLQSNRFVKVQFNEERERAKTSLRQVRKVKENNNKRPKLRS